MGPPVPVHVNAEVAFSLAIGRPIVVGQVEMRDSVVKGGAQDTLLYAEGRDIAKVVPQAQGDGRQLQAAVAAAAVFHFLITIFRGDILRHFESPPFVFYTMSSIRLMI